MHGLLTPVRHLRARRELTAARRAADLELGAARLPSPRLAWRSNELTSEEHRRWLAEALVDVVRASNSRYLPSASPLNRGAARAEADVVLRLAARLAERNRSVLPRGVVLVERLLTDGSGPLYNRERERDLRRALELALEALDPPSRG